MNEVYLRGKLVSVYEPIAPASQPKHLVYQLLVSHKATQQQVKFENYTVNARRNLAVWAGANLLVGMDVFVRGHLSQRQSSNGTMTEVTALTITPVIGRMAAVKATVDAAENTTEPQSTSELEVCPCVEATETSKTSQSKSISNQIQNKKENSHEQKAQSFPCQHA